MEVIVGTYEELTLSYTLKHEPKGYVLETSFTDHSHTGCVRTVAVSERDILATGSSDESIKLFNLKKRRDIGSLLHHNGYISYLTFYGKSHMFSCSADGTIGIWKTGSWECQKTLRGHKETVNAVSVHPSGKLAISVSSTKMRTWNLITGKCAYITNLKNGADIVRWTPDGTHYVITSNNTLDIYSVETATVVQTLKLDHRISCMDFLMDNIVLAGGEGGIIEFYDIKKESVVHTLDTETNRVKGIGVCTCGNDENSVWLTTGSSDGWIKIWKVSNMKGKIATSLDASVDTKFRIVSLAIKPDREKQTKKKHIAIESSETGKKVTKNKDSKTAQADSDTSTMDDNSEEDDDGSDSENDDADDSNQIDSSSGEYEEDERDERVKQKEATATTGGSDDDNDETDEESDDGDADKEDDELYSSLDEDGGDKQEEVEVKKKTVKQEKLETGVKRKLDDDSRSRDIKRKAKKKKDMMGIPKKKKKGRGSKLKQKRVQGKKWT